MYYYKREDTALLNANYRKAAIWRIGKKIVPELILVTNSDTRKLNARNVFYRYVNVSVTLIINDGPVGDLIGKYQYSDNNNEKP